MRERKSPRLPGWDYRSNGFYFVTICTDNRERYFGEIVAGNMILSPIGEIAKQYWIQIPDHFKYVTLDEFVIMPDHIHGIIKINRNHRCRRDAIYRIPTKNQFGPLIPESLSTVIHPYKSAVTRFSHRNGRDDFAWQSRYHDHIIRDHHELFAIRKYIKNNPAKWGL